MNAKKVLLVCAMPLMAVGAARADVEWNALWIKDTQGNVALKWNTAEYWQDGHVGGSDPAYNNVNLANPFGWLSSGSRSGQSVEISDYVPSVHSITGIPSQVITGRYEGHSRISVVDPGGFRGVWALSAFSGTYAVAPEGDNVALFRRVNSGENSLFNLTGGKTRIRDLIGDGTVRQNGTGELILDTPRNPRARLVALGSGKTTISSPDYGEPAIAPGAIVHFDAETNLLTTVENGREYVTNWLDAAGGEAKAYCPNADFRPFVTVTNGHTFVDFGAFCRNTSTDYRPEGSDTLYGPAGYMYIGQTNNQSVAWLNKADIVHEIIFVVKGHAKQADSGNFVAPLGSNGHSLYMDFTGASLYNVTYSVLGDNVYGGADYRAWMDGVPTVNASMNTAGSVLSKNCAWIPDELHVIAVHFEGGDATQHSSRPKVLTLGSARSLNGYECGGFMLGEALVYTNDLTDVARRQTIDYLKRKWMTGVESKAFDLDAVVIGNSGAKINVADGDSAKIRTARLARNVAASASVVKTGGGRLELEEVVPAAAAIDVQGGSVFFTHDTPAASTARSDVPTDGMICWLDATADASKFVKDGTGGITKWYDCRDGKDTVFATSVNTSGTLMPVLTEDGVSGLSMVDFSSTVGTTSPYMKITVGGSNLSGLKEGFIVWKRTAETAGSRTTPGFWSDGGRYGGYRNGNDTVTYPSWNYASVFGMNWTVDGRPIASQDGKDFSDAGYPNASVINFAGRNSLGYPYLALSFTANSGEGGGCQIGEVIGYNRVLTDAERRNVTAYLMNKWENKTYALDTDDTIAGVNFASGVQPVIGTDTDRTVSAITGSGTLVKTGAGKLKVSSLDPAVTNLEVAEGTLELDTGDAVAVAGVAGTGTLKCASVTGLTAIEATLDANGAVSCFTVEGDVTLAASGTVRLSLALPKPVVGRYPILVADSISGGVTGWTLAVTGESQRRLALSKDATGVYLEVTPPGMTIIIR